MATHPSAEKRNRQRIKRETRNRYHRATMRTHIKRLRAAVEAKDALKAAEALRVAVRALDSAAQKGVLHARTASRTISRLTLAVNRLAA
ncbi:MAG: 30S ribosomal protein S20 [Myxococcota bacterium]